MIQSASALPAPPAEAMPTELKPAATKKFRSSGASPRMNWLSGVKLSGPLYSFFIPVVASAGIRVIAFSIRIAKCSQSSSSSWNSNGCGSWSGETHGLAAGSNPPTSRPPTSSLM